MRNAFDRAYLDYRRALDLDRKPTFAYWGLLTIGRSIGVDPRTLEGMLQAAIKAEPMTSNVRMAYLESLRPEWGGSLEAMEAFLRETKKKYPGLLRMKEMEASLAGAKARLAVREGDIATAVKESEKAVQLARNEGTLRDRAWAHFRAKNYDLAIADANEAMKHEDCHPCALAIRGMANVRSGRHKEGLEDLHKSAAENNPGAQTELGMAYLFGRYGLAKDVAAGEKMCRRAADQRDAMGAYCLGGLYLAGMGVPKDDAQAVKWYDLAARLGLAEAQTDLGLMYASGRGVPKDREAALKLLALAAAQGNPRARGELERLRKQ
jgi:TPR repeat protein